MSFINDKVTFSCDTPQCSFSKTKYIKVANIVLQNFDFRCDQYRLELSGDDKEFFLIHNLKLFIKSEVLDFNMPEKTYSVSVLLINNKTSSVVLTRNHNVCIFPCDCTTTTTTTTPPPPTTTTTTTTTIPPDCCDWDGNGIIWFDFGYPCERITLPVYFTQSSPNIWTSEGYFGCGDYYSSTVSCNPEIQYNGPESCASKWSGSIIMSCVNDLTISGVLINCGCDYPPTWLFSGDGSNCNCCETTTTTTTPTPCCESLTIQFRTYSIPDTLTVYEQDGTVIATTGPISTGDDFITLSFDKLQCDFYFCVDAPLESTAWDLMTSGCLSINTSGGQNIDGIPTCWQEESSSSSGGSSSISSSGSIIGS